MKTLKRYILSELLFYSKFAPNKNIIIYGFLQF